MTSLAEGRDGNRAVPAPTLVTGGLAVYARGTGEPALLVPQPGGLTLGPPASHPLVGVLAELGRTVLTFDPPGSHRSTRQARLGMPELMSCVQETLDASGVTRPVDVLGHGTGALGALAFALAWPQRVRRLVLVGGVSGSSAFRRFHGMPYCWPVTSPDFWRFSWESRRLSHGRGDLAQHKRLLNLLLSHEYQDRSAAPPAPPVQAGDHQRPAPIRDRWPASIRAVDFRADLVRLFVPVLVCVGRNDPVTPVAAAGELTSLLPDASLVVFERSGHCPFDEEPSAFQATLAAFLHHGEMFGGNGRPLSGWRG